MPELEPQQSRTAEIVGAWIRKQRSRRALSKNAASVIAGGFLLVVGGKRYIAASSYNGDEDYVNSQFPDKYSSDEKEEAGDLLQDLDREAKDPTPNWREIEQRLSSEKGQRALEVFDYGRQKRDLLDETKEGVGSRMLEGVAAMSDVFVAWGLIGNGAVRLLSGAPILSHRDRLNAAAAQYQKTHNIVSDIKPEQLAEALSYLPPVGAKIPGVDRGNGWELYDMKSEPTMTMEEQVENILSLRRSGELGEHYVNQLTVQGQLPDEFKYVGIALILNSPWELDWEKPFIEYKWGLVAPLVHDGGVTQYINSYWDNYGRTDFIRRIVAVRSPNLEALESLPIEEVGQLSEAELNAARLEQYERSRLMIEARAYQRLALALHCKVGSAPGKIPMDVQTKLRKVWYEFSDAMKLVVLECGLPEMIDTPWFLKEARTVPNWPGQRYEADWPPVREQLVELENVRRNDSVLQRKVRELLVNSATKADTALGLL
ncbi:MAG TPA: hypothetical protein VLE91_04575 [Candidatus Saccharimonadales bacterium]|nr:hypothetical protein [Candidatus Saccharimonadales bacterium]